jgi:flagellar hook assembly protein FlgD
VRRLPIATIAAALLAAGVAAMPVPALAAAASSAKVVVVVGPTGDHNAHYKSDANDIVAEARRHTPNVVKLFTPNATWVNLKAAAQGANVFVYLGHGNGWPSIYPPFQTLTKDGLGLDPTTGADGSRHVYYGEDYIRTNIRFAPNAVVLLYHLCYASGNTEPGLDQGTFADARERVDNYGAGFIGAGARAVIAEGHPAHPAVAMIRQLFTTNRTLDQLFRAAPTWHGNLQGPFASQRTPGLAFELDADTAAPSGFYRSIVGDLDLRAGAIVGPSPMPTGGSPAAFVIPGAAEVVDPGGVRLYAHAAGARDPGAAGTATLANGTRLRLTAEQGPAADGTRVFAVTKLGTTTSGFVRATGLAPRDSAPTIAWSLDRSGGLLSPNDDGLNDGFVVAARLSESASASLAVRNAAGTIVRRQSSTGDMIRLTWNLSASGTPVRDGRYTWTLRAKDAWGNAAAAATGAFTVDDTPPVTRASAASTAGLVGWIVSPVRLTLRAIDALAGVRSILYRVDGGAARTYQGGVTITANGSRTFEYRATDKAGVKEAWRKRTFRIDTRPPSITVAATGKAGDIAGSWRSAVTLTPTIADATSGVAGRLVSVDGAPAKPMKAAKVVVARDGTHLVAFTATDAAGNHATEQETFLIDTVAPTLTLTGAGGSPATVTPNGDGRSESVVIGVGASEPAVVTAAITGPDGTLVRTLSTDLATGPGSLVWDGRRASGTPVADGRYRVTVTGRDRIGNTGVPVSRDVDVYAALTGLTRTPTLFFPQDGDRLARKATLAFRLLAPARLTVRVEDATGTVIRTAYANRAHGPGPVTWAWNGKRDDGGYAARGTYRLVVTATNGTQAATQATWVQADAFAVTASVTTAVRRHAFTVTARAAETLSRAPVVVVRQPGLAAWTVTMTRVTASTWTASVTPRAAGSTGTLALTVRARDVDGGANTTVLRVPLR